MVLNTRDYNLARGAADLLARLAKMKLPGEVKPEITESMIEINSVGARALRRAARGARTIARRDRRRRARAEPRRRRRRRAPVPPLERAAHLPDRALPARLGALRLPRQAVHRLRPAHPHRRAQRRRRGVPHARARALHPALHRALGLVALLAGRGHVVRDLAAARGVGLPALGPHAAGARLGRVQRATSTRCRATASSRA